MEHPDNTTLDDEASIFPEHNTNNITDTVTLSLTHVPSSEAPELSCSPRKIRRITKKHYMASKMDCYTTTDTERHFVKNMNEILALKQNRISMINNLEQQSMEKMTKVQMHFNSKAFIQIEPKTENIQESQNNEPSKPAKMPSCGTWFEECCNCCYLPQKCIASCCFTSSKCCKTITDRLKQLYFFLLYLFTGELNQEAVGYKNYFNVKSTKDDQVNVPEILVTAASIIFELYKTLIGSFLTVFTSQRCGSQTCTIWENIVPKNDLEMVGIICNFLMATTLLIEYIFEIMREAYLIKYLKYDSSLANNGEHIAELYEQSNKNIFTKLIPLYVVYIRFSYVVLLVYIINVVLSAVIVATNYYDNTSLFSFVTNALFIFYKIYNVVEITSYRGNYFYSAYKRKNIHYNTIKPKYLLEPTEHNDLSQTCSLENIAIDIEQPDVSLENMRAIFGYNYIPEKPILSDIDDGESLSHLEKEKVIHGLYEKKYIDKKVYRKLSMYLRKSEYGDVELRDL